MFNYILVLFLLLAGCRKDDSGLKIITLGDSYTHCEGITRDSCWVDMLTDNLNKEGIKTTLLANPAVSGYTTKDLIQYELPVVKKNSPDLCILLIGANDIFRNISDQEIQSNYSFIVSSIQKELKNKNHLVLLTIPDFYHSPYGVSLQMDQDIYEKLIRTNLFIQQTAKDKELECIDLFTISIDMATDPSLTCSDKLHPSGKEYILWEKPVREAIKKLTKK